MEQITLNRFLRLLKPLSNELKLELISRISELLKLDLKKQKPKNEKLLEELFGAWSDTQDNLAEEILKTRSVTDRDISFD